MPHPREHHSSSAHASTLTTGVVVQVQTLNQENLQLAEIGPILLELIQNGPYSSSVRPVRGRATIEIISGCHSMIDELRQEMHSIRRYLAEVTGSHGIMICGGGCAPLPPATLFGFNIRIGCADEVLAKYLCAAWQHYLPQFVALSAASPFCIGNDTGFVSYRAKTIESSVGESQTCCVHRDRSGEFIEISVCDTPLNLDTAVDLAAYAQALSAYLLAEVPASTEEVSVFNDHQAWLQAARYGLDGLIGQHDDGQTIGQDILLTIDRLRAAALPQESGRSLDRIEERVRACGCDAETIRAHLKRDRDMMSVVARMTMLWASALQTEKTSSVQS